MGSLHDVIRAPKLLVSAAASAALAISAAGCGEKEEPATTGPVITQTTSPTTTTTTTTPPKQGSPALTAAQFLVSPDAQFVCDELLTASFLRKEYGGRKDCLTARKPSTLADRNPKLIVTKRSGDSATVVAKPRGGRYGGKTLQFTVLHQGSAFRIISLRSN